MITLGLAGTGHLGEAMIAAAQQRPDLRLAAIHDPNPDRAATVAARWNLPALASYDDLLTDAVDAVVICSPNAAHVPQTLAALAAGKAVLVQKPLAITAGDARRIVDAADALHITKPGGLVVVDYTYRFLPTMAVLRSRLPAIGAVTAVRGSFHNIYGPGGWFHDPALAGGGALTDLGVHLIDLAIDLLRPNAVHLDRADLSHERGYAVEDAATVRIACDGVLFDLAVSWEAALPEAEIRLEISGTAGSLIWRNVAGSFFRFQTVHDGVVVIDQETSLREDTLDAFVEALTQQSMPPIHLTVYDVIDACYGRSQLLATPARSHR